MTVYADEAFLLNGAVDYLLLVCAAKLGGGRILRLRLALAAAFGGVYAAAALFPALAFVRQLPVKLAGLAAMLLIAFGAGRGTLRTGALFFAAVCAFSGAAVAAAQLFGTGVRVIRAFHKEAEETAQFAEENESLTRLQLFVGRISALMNPLTYVLINSAIVALIWTGAWQVERGALTQGQVVALVNYMSQILVELIKLANLIITITKAAACARRIESVFDENSSMTFPGEPAQDDPTAQDAVVFENVALRYSGAGAESLSGLSFRVRRGQTVGIIGGTGSGKTSLVNLIPRFYDATGGRILVDGVDVRDYPAGQLRSKIGIVPQKAVLFAGTIAENLRWGKEDATDAELQVALETSQAAEFVSTREGGLNAKVAQGGKNLSGGQRQRLTIARALVRDPEILILDDSASALDYATDARLRKAIRAHDANVTVFLVSQRAASIQYADQILVLDDGALVGQGTHAELLESCPVYQEIYYSQFPKEAQNA